METTRDDYIGVTEAELPRLGHIHIFTTVALLDHNAGGTGSYAHGNQKLGIGNCFKSLFLAFLREIWGGIGVAKRDSGKLGACFLIGDQSEPQDQPEPAWGLSVYTSDRCLTGDAFYS